MYKYYQPNKNQAPDCSIRALTKLLDKDWFVVFDYLVGIARKNQDVLISTSTFEEMLSDFNYQKYSFTRKGTKPRLREFAKEHNKGKYFCYVRSGYTMHCVCLDNGDWYDSWDSGDCKMVSYWTLN